MPRNQQQMILALSKIQSMPFKCEKMHPLGHTEWFPKAWECHNVVTSPIVENIFLRNPNPLLQYNNIKCLELKILGGPRQMCCPTE
jgi:hypothetical protein